MHRYGVLLRPYFHHWMGGKAVTVRGLLRGAGGKLRPGEKAGWCAVEGIDSREPFFSWLDYGAGRSLDLEKAPRSLLERALVKYCSPAEAAHFAVTFHRAPDNGRADGRCLLRYKRSGALISAGELTAGQDHVGLHQARASRRLPAFDASPWPDTHAVVPSSSTAPPFPSSSPPLALPARVPLTPRRHVRCLRS